LEECEKLASEGVVEVNLIAQDLTAYGRDRRDGSTLSRLLREMVRIGGLHWIRLLYNYPRYVTDDLLDTIAAEEKICSYIDIPLQHISDRMLRRMRRERSGDAIRRLLARVRERVPGVAIRTAFIVGFPGETEEDFNELVELVRQQRFARVGVFRYSKEEGTAAAELDGQVAEAMKRLRFHTLMRAQGEISRQRNDALIGSEQVVLVCGDDERGRLHGRLSTQAPEIDGVVRLRGSAPAGSFARARITAAQAYDLSGELVADPNP
jgi:ribosomal protein S12 methylthiotransferase